MLLFSPPLLLAETPQLTALVALVVIETLAVTMYLPAGTLRVVMPSSVSAGTLTLPDSVKNGETTPFRPGSPWEPWKVWRRGMPV